MKENNDTLYTSFLGTGWSFPPTFSRANKRVDMTSDEEDITSSLKILLSTTVGERLMQPKYGCNLNHLIFEPLNTTTKNYITGLIKMAILHFEPRIDLKNVTLNMESELEGKINIILEYSIKATNSRYNLVYPFYINEAANL